jgi:3-hydroxy-D-aspartate aldolase
LGVAGSGVTTPRDLGPNGGLIGKPGSRHEIGTPALVLDLDRLDANIASMAAHAAANGYALRPPMKIHKSVEIARRQIAAGAVGLCCATLSEAETLVAAGIPGVMLFTSIVTESKLDRLSTLNTQASDLTVVVDGFENVDQLGFAARRSGRRLRLMVDLEVGGGRTGVADPMLAVELARRIRATEGLEYVGLQAYVGNHQSIADYEERRIVSNRLLAPLRHAIELLKRDGLGPTIISGGGTGTHDIDAAFDIFTEIQAGSYVFMDVNYRLVEFRRGDPHPFAPALYVRTTVIGAAQPGFVITDAGAKELDGIFGVVAPEILNGAPQGSLYALVGDDMGRIDFEGEPGSFGIGSTVDVQPPHCYQTAVLYSVYHCVRDDVLVDIWPIDALRSW